MNSNYQKNRLRAIFTNDEPTMTDQSQGHETDINVIVGRYGIGGTAPGATGQPLYGDWTNAPEDMRAMIETSRRLEEHRAELPEQLREMPIQEILALTPEALTNILTPANPADKPNGDNK